MMAAIASCLHPAPAAAPPAAPVLADALVFQGNTTSSALTVATGDVVMVMVTAWNGSGATPAQPTLTDSRGNSYTVVTSYASGVSGSNHVLKTFVFECTAPAAGSTTWTVSGAGSFPCAAVAVISGADTSTPVDVSDCTNIITGTPSSFTSGNVTTNHANELLLGYTAIDADNGWLPTVGSGYTLQGAIDNSASIAVGLENADSGAAGSYAATFGASNTGPDFHCAQTLLIAIKGP